MLKYISTNFNNEIMNLMLKYISTNFNKFAGILTLPAKLDHFGQLNDRKIHAILHGPTT